MYIIIPRYYRYIIGTIFLVDKTVYNNIHNTQLNSHSIYYIIIHT